MSNCNEDDTIPSGRVAVTPVMLVPSPWNEPVKLPVNGAVRLVNCAELDTTLEGNVAVTPVILVPSPTKLPVKEPVNGEVIVSNCNEDEIRPCIS